MFLLLCLSFVVSAFAAPDCVPDINRHHDGKALIYHTTCIEEKDIIVEAENGQVTVTARKGLNEIIIWDALPNAKTDRFRKTFNGLLRIEALDKTENEEANAGVNSATQQDEEASNSKKALAKRETKNPFVYEITGLESYEEKDINIKANGRWFSVLAVHEAGGGMTDRVDQQCILLPSYADINFSWTLAQGVLKIVFPAKDKIEDVPISDCNIKMIN